MYCIFHGIEFSETERFPYLKDAREFVKTLDRYVFCKSVGKVWELRAIKADDGLTNNECYLLGLYFNGQIQCLTDGLKFDGKYYQLKKERE